MKLYSKDRSQSADVNEADRPGLRLQECIDLGMLDLEQAVEITTRPDDWWATPQVSDGHDL